VGWDVVRADLDELEELLLRYRPKLIYTNPTHHNPTGVTLPIRTRRELLDLAARYRVPIVEDDTYRELSLTTPAPASLFKLDESHRVVIRVNSFSKMLAPGLRLGWISAVKSIVDQLALIKQQVDPHTQNLSQLVVCELIARGVFDRHVLTLKTEHRRRRDATVHALRPDLPPPPPAPTSPLQAPGGGDVFVLPAPRARPRAARAGSGAARIGDGRDRRAVLRGPGRIASASDLLHLRTAGARGEGRAHAGPRHR